MSKESQEEEHERPNELSARRDHVAAKCGRQRSILGLHEAAEGLVEAMFLLAHVDEIVNRGSVRVRVMSPRRDR